MGSSAGRRDADYVRHRNLYQQGHHACWLNTGPWCTGIGLTVDHDPAMHLVGGHTAWRALYRQHRARYMPACKPCQDRQGRQLQLQRAPEWTF